MANNKISFSEEDRQKIIELAKEFPDLNTITRKFFNDEALDGRTRQGIAIRSLLASNKIQYKTSKYEKVGDLPLTPEQEQFIEDQAKNGISALRIAELLFPDRPISAMGQATGLKFFYGGDDVGLKVVLGKLLKQKFYHSQQQ